MIEPEPPKKPKPRGDREGWLRGTIHKAIGVWKVGLIAAAVLAAGCIGAHDVTIESVKPKPKTFCLLQCVFGFGISRARLMEMRRVAPPPTAQERMNRDNRPMDRQSKRRGSSRA